MRDLQEISICLRSQFGINSFFNIHKLEGERSRDLNLIFWITWIIWIIQKRKITTLKHIILIIISYDFISRAVDSHSFEIKRQVTKILKISYLHTLFKI